MDTTCCESNPIYSEEVKRKGNQLIETIKNMPDFEEVFGEHVNECMKNGTDPFEGFVVKAVICWDLFHLL